VCHCAPVGVFLRLENGVQYIDIDHLRGPAGYLDQLVDSSGIVDTSKDTILLDVLERAESFVNAYLGTTASLAAATATTAIVYGTGTQVLPLPPLTAGSVTSVTTLSGYTVPDYIEQDGALVITDSTGVVSRMYNAGLAYAYGSTVVWSYGVPYTVSATFGWPAGDLAVLAEATLQVAVQLWRYKDAGGSETIGAEGAITTVRAGWTPLVKSGLDSIKRRLAGNSVGVW
jgi:hypothetical protein